MSRFDVDPSKVVGFDIGYNPVTDAVLVTLPCRHRVVLEAHEVAILRRSAASFREVIEGLVCPTCACVRCTPVASPDAHLGAVGGE